MAAAPERSWTEEKEKTLIAFFSKNSCLWNYKSENYKNRDLRWKTLEHLRILLSFQPPPVPFTVEDIKNKFKNLRTTFQRQYKLVRQSGEAGLVPQWKHYQQLSFLQGCCEPEEGADETPPSPPAEENWLPPTSPGLGISFLHSSSSGGAAGRSFWTEERERELIAFYAEHGCLWNRKSENHNNRQLRQKLLESLRIRLSDQLVLFSVEDVKSKFKNLRTVFNREFKAVQASRTSDQPYVSKWKHFHQMLFLCESFEEDEFPDGPHEGSRTSCSQSGVSASSFDACSIKTESNTISCSAFQGLFPSAPDQTELMDPRAPSGSPPDRKPGRVLVPADDRASGESRCLWSEAKVQQLISFYAEHSCLWNHRVDSFRNRLLRQSLLETLSGLLSAGEPVPFTVEDIKTKFRNLRTIFQREHKAVSANRTCGSEDFYLPKWRHYLDLLFLCDSDSDEAFAQTRPASAQNPAVPPAPTPPRSWLSCSSSSSSSSSSTRSRKRAGRPAAAPRSGRRGEAPHAGFLKYVEECLNEAPPHKVKRMKKKIIETIHNLEEDG